MALRINDVAPDFKAQSTHGPIDFHQWIGDKWAILFSHPKDFTPVCTTELGYMAKIEPEFTKRNVKLVGLSVDPSECHARWLKDIEETQGSKVNYPLIADTTLRCPSSTTCCRPRSRERPKAAPPPQIRPCARSSSLGRTRRSSSCSTYPMTTGRNFDEILRVVDSMQLTAKHKVATPANWKHGDDVIIAGSVSDDDAKTMFPAGWKTPKPYIRIVKQPV